MPFKHFIIAGTLALLAAPAWATPAYDLRNMNQCPVTLEKGQPLHVTLATNGSAGYQWQLTDSAAGVLTATGQAAHVDDTAQVAYAPGENMAPKPRRTPGSDTLLRWSFDTHAAGSGELTLVKLLPRMYGNTPQQTFNCAITVKP